MRRRFGLALLIGAIVAAFVNPIAGWLLAFVACSVLATIAETRRASAASLAILVVSATLAFALEGVVVGAFGKSIAATAGIAEGAAAEAAAFLGFISPWLAAAAFGISRRRSRSLAVAGSIVAILFMAVPATALVGYSAWHPDALPPDWIFMLSLPALLGIGLVLAGIARDFTRDPFPS